MPIRGLDHVAFPVQNAEPMLAFYRAIGCEVTEDYVHEGTTLLASARFGDSKLNLHMPGFWDGPAFPKAQDGTVLRGPTAQPGCGDICLVWDGTVDSARATFEAAGAPVIEGPVPRAGSKGGQPADGTSVYCRDPDGNLVEFIVYP